MVKRGKSGIISLEREELLVQGKSALRQVFRILIQCALLGAAACAQQAPPSGTGPAAQVQTPAPGGQGEGLNDPLLQATDDENVLSNLFSRVMAKYDHLLFSNGSEGDRVRISGQQALGPRNRLGLAYEIPYFNIHGGNAANGAGLGDIKVEFNSLLSKTDRFSHAARAEFTLPSASNPVVGLGQNIVRAAWGFSTPLSRRTVLSGVLAYNKGMTARPGQKGLNTIEPEAILTQEFTRRMAGFLDWDTYRDFNADRFGQTMKSGFAFQLDRRGRWTGSPYAQFPLNHFTSSTNLKSDIGFDLTWRY